MTSHQSGSIISSPSRIDKIPLYLGEIHNKLSKSLLSDLHAYFYWVDLEVCPICNEWLVERCKPEATT